MSNKQDKRLKDRIHQWINRHYPRTGKCQNSLCLNIPSKRTEYSLLHGKEYSKNIKNYRELCVSCHKRYDITAERNKKVSESKKGKSAFWNKKRVLAVSKDTIIVFDSIVKASIELNIGQTSISNCLNKKSKTAGGFGWRYQLV